MPRLMALTDWSGRKAGDVWDASDADARLLCAVDLPGGQRARIVADDEDVIDTRPLLKGRYNRRDFRAKS